MSRCGNHTDVIGGYDVTGNSAFKRTFYLGEEYSDLVLKFKMLFIDDFSLDNFYIMVDRKIVYTETLPYLSNTDAYSNTCG